MSDHTALLAEVDRLRAALTVARALLNHPEDT